MKTTSKQPRYPNLTTDIRKLPVKSGVYIMKDSKGGVLYIGKAVNIRKRVASYFNRQDKRFLVTVFLPMVNSVDFLVTENEKEALILENGLIKSHKPKYNVLLKDDKSEYCLRVNTGHPFPRLEIMRMSKRRKDDALYFGPYSSSGSVRQTLEFIQKIFPLRSCTDRTFDTTSRPCLEYHIKRCHAPCVGLIDAQDYARILNAATDFLKGRKKEVLDTLKKQRAHASHELRFETAQKLHRSITAIEQTLEKQNLAGGDIRDTDTIVCVRENESAVLCIIHSRGGRVRGYTQRLFSNTAVYDSENEMLEELIVQFYERTEESSRPDRILVSTALPQSRTISALISASKKTTISAARTAPEKSLVRFAVKTARAELDSDQLKHSAAVRLKNVLNLKHDPDVMACFDISHQSGTQVYGSMSIFKNLVPDKKAYRTFKLEGGSFDDCANMKKALTRWFAKDRELKINLLIIDGGRTQLKTAEEVLNKLNIKDIDLVSVAKSENGRDRILFPGGRQADKDMEQDIFSILMHIRDEAHRFGIRHSRSGLEKKNTSSILDSAPGIGHTRKKRLLEIFGSIQKIKQADARELETKALLPPKTAQKLYNYLHGKDTAV